MGVTPSGRKGDQHVHTDKSVQHETKPPETTKTVKPLSEKVSSVSQSMSPSAAMRKSSIIQEKSITSIESGAAVGSLFQKVIQGKTIDIDDTQKLINELMNMMKSNPEAIKVLVLSGDNIKTIGITELDPRRLREASCFYHKDTNITYVKEDVSADLSKRINDFAQQNNSTVVKVDAKNWDKCIEILEVYVESRKKGGTVEVEARLVAMDAHQEFVKQESITQIEELEEFTPEEALEPDVSIAVVKDQRKSMAREKEERTEREEADRAHIKNIEKAKEIRKQKIKENRT